MSDCRVNTRVVPISAYLASFVPLIHSPPKIIEPPSRSHRACRHGRHGCCRRLSSSCVLCAPEPAALRHDDDWGGNRDDGSSPDVALPLGARPPALCRTDRTAVHLGRRRARSSAAATSTTQLAARRRRNDPNDNLGGGGNPPNNALFDATAFLASVVSTPVPVPLPIPLIASSTSGGATTIPLGYPLSLAVAAAALPLSTSLLLDVFFVAYWIMGRAVTGGDDDDDDDDDNSGAVLAGRDIADLTALAGAVASAGLLSPDGFAASPGDVTGMMGLPGPVGSAAVALAGVAVAGGLVGQQEAQEVEGAEEEDGGSRANGKRMMELWDEKLKRSDGGDD